jgi:malonyl-CoA decarboxylase
VAQFHLGNGARVERLNPLADTSKRGLEQSWGMMVNYAYRLPDIEDNLEAYTAEGKIAAASAVAGLL